MNNRIDRTSLAILAAVSLTAAVTAQPALSIRFASGQSEITVAPGAQVPLTVYVTGMPVGAPVPWTTPPGTGQIGQYQGFLSVLFDMQATGGSWSNYFPAPGHGFPIIHWSPTPFGSNLNGINIGVGFNPPVPGAEFDLLYATLTVGSTDVHLNTLIRPTGAPPQTGLEVALAGIIPGPPPLNVSHFMTTLNGTAVIHVPSPAPLTLLALAGLTACRSRRRGATT